jgi:hypothetical protein
MEGLVQIMIRPAIFLLKNVQTSSGIHPALYSVGIGVWSSFLGIKELGYAVDH